MSPERKNGIFFSAPLVVLWGATVALMWWNHVRDPFDPLLEGTARYGHNPAGAFPNGLGLISVELAVAVLLLRPWARPTLASALIGLLLAAPWALCSMLMTMHAGGILAIHFVWTAVLAVYLFVMVVVAAHGPARGLKKKLGK